MPSHTPAHRKRNKKEMKVKQTQRAGGRVKPVKRPSGRKR